MKLVVCRHWVKRWQNKKCSPGCVCVKAQNHYKYSGMDHNYGVAPLSMCHYQSMRANECPYFTEKGRMELDGILGLLE